MLIDVQFVDVLHPFISRLLAFPRTSKQYSFLRQVIHQSSLFAPLLWASSFSDTSTHILFISPHNSGRQWPCVRRWILRHARLRLSYHGVERTNCFNDRGSSYLASHKYILYTLKRNSLICRIIDSQIIHLCNLATDSSRVGSL